MHQSQTCISIDIAIINVHRSTGAMMSTHLPQLENDANSSSLSLAATVTLQVNEIPKNTSPMTGMLKAIQQGSEDMQ